MKTIGIFILAAQAAVLLLSSGCEVMRDKNDDCSDTEMALKEPLIYLHITIPGYELPDDHHAVQASKMTFSGSVTKIYCSGDISSTFEFSPSFIEDENLSGLGYLLSGAYLPQPYQFKFENTKDYLQLVGRLTFYFDYDGKIYESTDFYFRYYFEDIHYEPNDMKDYIQISPGVLGFAEVTSGPF